MSNFRISLMTYSFRRGLGSRPNLRTASAVLVELAAAAASSSNVYVLLMWANLEPSRRLSQAVKRAKPHEMMSALTVQPQIAPQLRHLPGRPDAGPGHPD